MKVLGADLILLVVGLLLVGGAGWPLVQGGYLAQNAAAGGGPGGQGLFDVAFSTAEQAAKQQNVPNMASSTAVFVVTDGNVTKVKVEVSCTDAAAGAQASPFTFSITITGPGGLTGSDTQNSCGPATVVEIMVAPVPGAKKIGGADAGAAEAASRDANATKGQGNWTVTTSGQRGTGVLPVQPIAPPPGIAKLAVTTWTAKATPAPATK